MICDADANANILFSSSFSLSLSVYHSLFQPLQYTPGDLDDLDYTQFYDYSEGATETIPTEEYSEPQVNGGEKGVRNV